MRRLLILAALLSLIAAPTLAPAPVHVAGNHWQAPQSTLVADVVFTPVEQ